jgi:hypothetical protein
MSLGDDGRHNTIFISPRNWLAQIPTSQSQCYMASTCRKPDMSILNVTWTGQIRRYFELVE